MKKIAILVSGNGSNLQRIIDAVQNKEINNIEISQVIADRNCYALVRSLDFDIPSFIIDKSEDINQELNDIINQDLDLIVLAGFLSIIPDDFCEKWNNKIINIHPSLLPKYGGKGMWGRNVHNAVLENKETVSGATVHFVTKEIDAGQIILQKETDIVPNETIDSLTQKIHLIEHEILVEALKLLLK